MPLKVTVGNTSNVEVGTIVIDDGVDHVDHTIRIDNNGDGDEVMVVEVNNERSKNFNSLNAHGYVKPCNTLHLQHQRETQQPSATRCE